MIYVDKMEVNELNSPIGLDDQNPSFSWNINCDCYNLKQTHYQIKVSTDKFDSKENLIWDSGKIESSNSIRIRYDGSSLKYDTDYYWQITIWTNKNNRLRKSKISSWSTGLMKEENWKKKWISVEDIDDTKKNSNSPYFINEFVVEKKNQKSKSIHNLKRYV
jgi:alpha-L-rhamnosidase